MKNYINHSVATFFKSFKKLSESIILFDFRMTQKLFRRHISLPSHFLFPLMGWFTFKFGYTNDTPT